MQPGAANGNLICHLTSRVDESGAGYVPFICRFYHLEYQHAWMEDNLGRAVQYNGRLEIGRKWEQCYLGIFWTFFIQNDILISTGKGG
jgi:hypothetical protein